MKRPQAMHPAPKRQRSLRSTPVPSQYSSPVASTSASVIPSASSDIVPGYTFAGDETDAVMETEYTEGETLTAPLADSDAPVFDEPNQVDAPVDDELDFEQI
jgi:hypothetical protein